MILYSNRKIQISEAGKTEIFVGFLTIGKKKITIQKRVAGKRMR